MRLISLVLALVIVGGLVIYNKNSLLPGGKPGETVKQHANRILDNTKDTAADLQKQMQDQQKKIQQNTN